MSFVGFQSDASSTTPKIHPEGHYTGHSAVPRDSCDAELFLLWFVPIGQRPPTDESVGCSLSPCLAGNHGSRMNKMSIDPQLTFRPQYRIRTSMKPYLAIL